MAWRRNGARRNGRTEDATTADSYTFSWASVSAAPNGSGTAEGDVANGSGESNGPLLLTVADGVGGFALGGEASRRAVAAATSEPIESDVDVVERLKAGDKAVRDYVRSVDGAFQPATTLTIAEFTEASTLNVAHVGDSRLYLFAGDELIQATVDQNSAQDLLSRGVITEDQFGDHPGRRELTSGCGLFSLTVQHIPDLELQRGDRVLLCSGAIGDTVSEVDIAGTLAGGPAPADAAQALVAAATGAGASDLVTAAVVHVTG